MENYCELAEDPKSKWKQTTHYTILRSDSPKHSEIITCVIRSKKLNNAIAEQIVENVRGGGYVLVYTERVGHCRTIKEEILEIDPSIGVGIISGDKTQEERLETISRMDNGEIKVIIGTITILEGFRFSKVDTVHIGFSFRENYRIYFQLCKHPKVMTLHDWRVKVLSSMEMNRQIDLITYSAKLLKEGRHVPIVVFDKCSVSNLLALAFTLKVDIPTPLVYDQFIKLREGCVRSENGFLLYELDKYLDHCAFGIPILNIMNFSKEESSKVES